MNSRDTYKMLLWLLLLSPLPLCAQVDICYDFESAPGNSRPMGWGALPNLDFHYVGVISGGVAHTGSKALHNNGTTCYTIMPDEGLNYGADSVWLTFWYYLHNNTDYFDVGYLTDPTDSTTFHLLATVHEWSQEWHFFALDLSSVPTGARIAFFGHDMMGSDGTFWLDDVYLTDAPCWLWGLHVAEITADSVWLEWHKAGNPSFSVGWGDHTYYPTGTSVTLPRRPYFSNVIPYEITYCSLPSYYNCTCRGSAQGVYSNIRVMPYRQASCVSVEDDFSTAVIPYSGTPVNPYLSASTRTTTTQGITGIFAGSHTLNTNPGSDGGGMMVFPRTIPPGDNATMRLGNRLGDWESASMLYTITVDTSESDILVMKYTMAMAFGSMQTTPIVAHNDTLHPAWFCIELMDDTMGLIQPEGCNRFYINAWDTAGWDEMNSMYKRRNFTGMAFNLAPYHGQQLHLRVTATDGAVNNRWCYGYYNIECLKRNDIVSECEGDSVLLGAPYGFNYRWWRDGDNTTLSTDQVISVATDGALYHCELVDRFNPDCRQTISRRVLEGVLLTVFDTVVENALPHSYRGMVFDNTADTMFSVPAAVGCDTVVHYRLHVWPNRSFRMERRFCPGDWPVVWEGQTFNGADSVTFALTDMHGADSTVTLVALEAPDYEVGDTTVFCPGMPYVYNGVQFDGPVAFDTVFPTVDGCDSLVHVALIPRDSTFRLSAFHSIDGHSWADSLPIVICSNQTLYVVDSTLGAEAWQWRLGSAESVSLRQAEFYFTAGDSIMRDTLALIVNSAYGCNDTLLWPVLVIPAPTAVFAWNPSMPADMCPEVQLLNYSEPPTCQWMWLVTRIDGAMDTLTEHSPCYRWEGDLPHGDFDVTLAATMTVTVDSVQHLCSDTARHAVTIATSLLQFPNLVTPNDDGVNDCWEVVNLVELGQYPMNELWIFNSWGVQVFHARNIIRHGDFWNPNQPFCPDGTYFYRFMARSEYGVIRQNGTIEVLR